MSVTNVKDFGAIGDGVTDDTQAFLDALDILLNTFGKGVLYCPSGTYKISQQLEIPLPFVGIKGDGVEASTLFFYNSSGLKLTEFTSSSTFYGFSQAVIEDITLTGPGAGGSGYTYLGIEMDKSNFYYFNRFWIKHFDIGVNATTSVLNKFEHFSVSGCKIGLQFTNASWANTIINGNVNGGTEAGIVESGSEVYITMTDIEAIGVYNATTGRYDNGTAIVTGTSSTVRDCHIELCGNGIGLNSSYGEVFIENSVFAGCVTGVKQLYATPVGRYYFKNLHFGDCDTEFDISDTTVYDIQDCMARYAGGAEKTPVINAAAVFGVIKSNSYSSSGYWVSYTNTPGISVNGKEVWAGKRFNAAVNIGTVAANSSIQIPVTIDPAYTGVSLSVWTDKLVFHLVYPDCTLPAGLWVDACVATTNIDPDGRTKDFVLNVSNVTGSAINMGTPTFAFRTI